MVLALAWTFTFVHPLRAQVIGPPRADQTVRELIAHVAERDTSHLALPFPPEFVASLGITRDSMIRTLVAGFDIGEVRSATVIDRTEFHPFNATRVDEKLTYHIIGSRGSRVAFVDATTDSGRTWLTGINWREAPADLREVNPFALGGRSWLHFLFLVLAVLVPLFSIATAIAAARSTARYKWVWAVASLFGLGKLGIAWTASSASEAAIRFSPISFQLLGASYSKYPLYAPWVISFSLPLFALGYWMFGRRRLPQPPPTVELA